MTELLLIGGRSGVGKTSVALAVHELLVEKVVTHAVVEGDYLDLASPAPERGFAERNLSLVWAEYAAAGYERLVYSQTVSVLQVDQICDAVDPDAVVTAVLLTAPDHEIERRLRAREATAQSAATHLSRSKAMGMRLDSNTSSRSVRLDTHDRSVADLARTIVALTGWS